jgi:hypothetical protein
MSAIASWSEFLKEFASAAGTESWPGEPGATEEQLYAVEQKLKVKLPPSYRAFLTASNGWRGASQSIPILRGVQKLKWFRKEHRDWVEAYTMEGMEPPLLSEQDYFNYGSETSGDFDISHLGQTLCISELGDDAVLLLNPMVVWPDGEWEVWFFANWVPGATRYRSFADWMREQLAQLQDETFVHSTNPGELPTVYLDRVTKANRRVRRREEVHVLETVLGRLTSKKPRERVKAAQQLARLGGPVAIKALLESLNTDPDPDVRCTAAESLGKLRAPEAVETLIATASDHFIGSTMIEVLGKFDDERSAQYLLQIVERNEMMVGVASHALAKRGDNRAVLHLARILTSPEPLDQHTGNIAGRFIAEFQEAGYSALEPLATHPQKEIRSRAQNGIGDLAFMAKNMALRIKSRELLQRCLAAETDDQLRHFLGVEIEITKKKSS